MLHTFTDVEYADMLNVYGFCYGSAPASAVEKHRRWFPIHRISERRMFSKVLNTLRKRGTHPSAHDSSERARQHVVKVKLPM
jgi:hypothetical protein